MKSSTLRKRFTIVLIVQAILILLLWLYYHYTTLDSINQSAHENAALSADVLLNEISGEFEHMRAVCGAIAGSVYVQDFLAETNVSDYYEKAVAVSEIVNKTAFPISASDSVVTVSAGGEYYRFSGALSNAACEKLYTTFKGEGAAYTIIELDNTAYFCHSSPVLITERRQPKHIGNVVMLISAAKTRRLLESGDTSDTDMLILHDNTVLLSSKPDIEGKSESELKAIYDNLLLASVEGTSLQVGAAINNTKAKAESRRFLLLSVVIIALMLCAIFLMHGYLSKEINVTLNRTERYHMGLMNRQINTHFIMNTLIFIKSLASSGDNDKAALATDELIKLIKHMQSGDTLVNIFLEMEIAESYINLMNIRYADKFIAEFDVDDALSEYRMPGFILQPIVENALTHGLQSKANDCRLTIYGKRDKDKVLLQVTDNGIGMSQEQLHDLRDKLSHCHEGDFAESSLHGVALCNIQRRIRTLYGEDCGITIDSISEKGTTATILLPIVEDM